MAKRMRIDVQMVVDDWKRRIGKAAHLFAEEVQQAMVAQCVMSVMITQSVARPDNPVKDYVDLYQAACEHLFPGPPPE